MDDDTPAGIALAVVLGAGLAAMLALAAWLVLFAVAFAGAAFADSQVSIGGSMVVLEPHDGPATAQVIYYNRPTNRRDDEGEHVLELDGLTIRVRFEWNVNNGGSDRIIIIPEDGFIAIPDVIDLPEGDTERALIFPAMS